MCVLSVFMYLAWALNANGIGWARSAHWNRLVFSYVCLTVTFQVEQSSRLNFFPLRLCEKNCIFVFFFSISSYMWLKRVFEYLNGKNQVHAFKLAIILIFARKKQTNILISIHLLLIRFSVKLFCFVATQSRFGNVS